MTLPSGRTLHPSQCTSTYIFPGVGLGALISRCTKLRDEQFIAAADAVSRMVGEDDLARGSLFPALSKVGVGRQRPLDKCDCLPARRPFCISAFVSVVYSPRPVEITRAIAKAPNEAPLPTL